MLIQENTLFADRYRLIRQLGQGGFSEVWLAEDDRTGIRVAVKIYAPGRGLDDDGVRLFSQEFSLVFNLNHTNLLKPTYYDVSDKMPYLVMPYCEQGACSRLVGEMSEEQLWRFLAHVASGLAYLHSPEPPIIHQDIKPDNVLIDSMGNYLITDFGISTKARSTLRKSAMQNQVSGGGTLSYMGPERFSRESIPVKASDVWSLGATMFELMTGYAPFGEHGGLLLKGGADIPDIPGSWSDDLKKIVELCLQKETWDRPNTESLITWTEQHFKGEKISFISKEESKKKSKQKRLEKNKRGVDKSINSKKWRFGAYIIGGLLLLSIWIFLIIPSQTDPKIKYEYIGDFSEGFAPVRLDGKYGFINADNEEIIPLKYDTVELFQNGYAHVKDSLWGYIDTVGNEFISLRYPKEITMNEALKGKWTRKKDSPFKGVSGSVSFSIGNKGYVVGGSKGGRFIEDVWEYDSENDSWIKKNDFAGGKRVGLFYFIINDKVYIGGGYYWAVNKDRTSVPGTNLTYVDLWEYNVKNDSWTRKKDMPVNHSLAGTAAFAMNGRGYVTTGHKGASITAYNDLYEYDPSTDTWTKKKDFPGKKRYAAFGFASQEKGYVGGGQRYIYEEYNDFWEYDPKNDKWIQKNNMPGRGAHNFVIFTVKERFFRGLGHCWNSENGYLLDFWEYNVKSDQWYKKSDFPGEKRDPYSFSFVIDNKAYMGGGVFLSIEKNTVFSDVWEFDPNVEGEIEEADTSIHNLTPVQE